MPPGSFTARGGQLTRPLRVEQDQTDPRLERHETNVFWVFTCLRPCSLADELEAGLV